MSSKLFSQHIGERVQHVEPVDQVPWHVHDKVKCYRFCDSIGVRRATVFQCERDVHDLNFDALPDRFVLKPTTGHSAQAIMPLIRDVNKGLYFDLFRRAYRSLDDIIAIQQTFQQKNQFKDSYHILAEEMLRPESGRIEIPHDFKLYVFRAGVGLIMQKNVNARPYQCNAYYGDWQRVPLDELFDFQRSEVAAGHLRRAAEQGYVAPGVDAVGQPELRLAEGQGQPPACATEAIAIAQRILEELDTSFCRVDIYATLKGCVVGELTLSPGGLWAGAECFAQTWEERLGSMWESDAVSMAT